MIGILEKQTNIENPNGSKFLISTVRVAGEYQTAVLDDNFMDLEENRTNVLTDALKWHEAYIGQYTQKIKSPVKLSGKYIKLVEDLKKCADNVCHLGLTEDGGTCNFDSLELTLPRWNEEKTIAAIEAAGLHGYKSTVWRTVVYVISPPMGGQGNARTRQAEAMRGYMEGIGYSASVYYAMD